MRPSPEQVREVFTKHREDCRCEPHAPCLMCACLESALAPPPVEDAAVEEALEDIKDAHIYGGCMIGVTPYPDGDGPEDCTCGANERHETLRAALAAKDAEIERAWDEAAQERKRARDWESAHDARMAERDEARAALAAAEDRGFREAVDWFDDEAYVKKECIVIARAEADRREGK